MYVGLGLLSFIFRETSSGMQAASTVGGKGLLEVGGSDLIGISHDCISTSTSSSSSSFNFNCFNILVAMSIKPWLGYHGTVHVNSHELVDRSDDGQ